MANWKEWQFEREYNETLRDAYYEESIGNVKRAEKLFDYAEDVARAAWFYAGVML